MVRTGSLTPILLTVLTLTAHAADLAPHKPFTLPLTDGTTANAIFLPAPTGLHLIWSDPTGQLRTALLTESKPVPPEPIPPKPTTPLSFAIVHDPATTTPEQLDTIADPALRTNLPPNCTYAGLLPNDLIDPTTGKPPAHLAPYLTAAATTTLPAVVAIDPTGHLITAQPLPETLTALLTLLKTLTGVPTHDPTHRVRHERPDPNRNPQRTTTQRPERQTRLLHPHGPPRLPTRRRPSRSLFRPNTAA